MRALFLYVLLAGCARDVAHEPLGAGVSPPPVAPPPAAPSPAAPPPVAPPPVALDAGDESNKPLMPLANLGIDDGIYWLHRRFNARACLPVPCKRAELSMEIAVGADGAIGSVIIRSGDPTIGACLAKRLRARRFSAGTGGTVVMPFRFECD